MARTPQPRRTNILSLTTALLGVLLILQLQPSCVPTGTTGDPTLGGQTVINQTGRELTAEELNSLAANAGNGQIVVVFLNPNPGPAGPQGPLGPQGLLGPAGPAGPSGTLVGEVRQWAGSYRAVPPGWVLCDGRLLPANDFPELYGVLGRRWSNAADDPTLFRVPDLRNRSPMGADGESADGLPTCTVEGNPTSSGGEAFHTLTIDEMPVHHHDMSHVHSLPTVTYSPGTGVVMEGGTSANSSLSTAPAYPSITGDAGLGWPHPVLDPYFALTYIVFTGR
ncbi:MAG: tail fiber protein [Planctomycetes bacterium]|nr:tail fiber protein [Planctomycetota bacterium]